MKILLQITFFLLLTYSGLAQNNTPRNKEQLVASWSIDYEKSISNMDSIPKKTIANNPFLKSSIEKNYKGRQIVFETNGNFLQIQADGSEKTGKWTLNEEDNIVRITSPNGQEFPFEITNLNTNYLVLKFIGSTEGNLYFEELYYDKI